MQFVQEMPDVTDFTSIALTDEFANLIGFEGEEQNIGGCFDFSDDDGRSSSTVTVPTDYSMDYPYPNPFDQSLSINLTLPSDDNVSILVYNDAEEAVGVILEQTFLEAGTHAIYWDGQVQLLDSSELVPYGYYRIIAYFEDSGYTCYANIKREAPSDIDE